ncbi:hypothetical protein ACDX78_07910 [Virgibacillus oceani]
MFNDIFWAGAAVDDLTFVYVVGIAGVFLIEVLKAWVKDNGKIIYTRERLNRKQIVLYDEAVNV